MLRLVLALALLPGACQKDETVSGYADPAAVYVLQELDGAPVAAPASIGFPVPGRIEGQGPCNGYAADLTVPYPWFQVENLSATRRACPDLAAEAAFLQALQAMSLSEVAGGVLILSNDAGQEMVFRAQ